MKRRGGAVSIAFRDILYLIAFMYLLLVVIVLPALNPPADPTTKSVTPPGNMAVSIAWPAGPSDVDLWVHGPNQAQATGYSNRSGKLWSLLRDDLGIDGDLSPINMENAFARSTPAGEYAVNIHGYSLPFGPVKVFVEVSMGAQADRMKTLVSTEIELRNREERTVVRFKLDGNGNVVPGSVNQIFLPLRSSKK